jgi:hypothetical protein
LIANITLSIPYDHSFDRSLFGARAPAFALEQQSPGEGGIEMMERLLDAEVAEDGTILEEIELICTMTGSRRRFLIHHLGGGFFRSVELPAG